MRPAPAPVPAQRSWSVGAASVRGAAHARRGQPNQDAFAYRTLPDGTLVAAVADGHGARRHHRSQTGARLAVDAALACLARPDMPVDAVPARIVELWRRAVLADAARTPDPDAWIGAEDETVVAYGTTLIALRVDGERLCALQIGDGDLVLGTRDGRLTRPLPDDLGLFGETTHSLCEPDSVRHFRAAMFDASMLDFAMLSTDGLGKSFAGEADLLDVARVYRDHAGAGRLEAVLPALPDWLAEVSGRGSGDDVTLLLAGTQAPPAAPAVHRTGRG